MFNPASMRARRRVLSNESKKWPVRRENLLVLGRKREKREKFHPIRLENTLLNNNTVSGPILGPHFLITPVRPTNSHLRSVYSSKMPFETTELSSNADFGELVRVEWESYEQPYCRLLRLFFPILDNGPDARAKAMEESTERQLQWHNGDPTSHWIKVVDTETRRITGAACWHIYEENPYSTQSDEECTWYPAGEAREMANSLMGQFLTPRTKYMAKPHICMIATHG